jgi:hypothetical protein
MDNKLQRGWSEALTINTATERAAFGTSIAISSIRPSTPCKGRKGLQLGAGFGTRREHQKSRPRWGGGSGGVPAFGKGGCGGSMPPIPNSRPVELREGYHLSRTAVFLERTPAFRLMKVIPTGMWSPCSHRDATNEPSSTGLFRKRSGCGLGDIGLCECRFTIDDATKARRRLSTSMVVSAAKPMDVVLTLVLAAEAWG